MEASNEFGKAKNTNVSNDGAEKNSDVNKKSSNEAEDNDNNLGEEKT